jgi:hypothetical protein
MREISQRLSVRQQTVAMWKLRGLMPTVRWEISGNPAWNWPDIEKWARESGRLEERRKTPRADSQDRVGETDRRQ